MVSKLKMILVVAVLGWCSASWATGVGFFFSSLSTNLLGVQGRDDQLGVGRFLIGGENHTDGSGATLLTLGADWFFLTLADKGPTRFMLGATAERQADETNSNWMFFYGVGLEIDHAIDEHFQLSVRSNLLGNTAFKTASTTTHADDTKAELGGHLRFGLTYIFE